MTQLTVDSAGPDGAIANYLRDIDRALKIGNATEHTYRPALKTLLEALRPNSTATNEPQRIACGSPDFIITRSSVPIGYVEAKDLGVNLDAAEESEQLMRYRVSLRNLILTDYLQFRLFRNGEVIQRATLASFEPNRRTRRNQNGPLELISLLDSFFDAEVPTIANPQELAERMARIARLLHDLIRKAFSDEGQKGDLHAQYDAFQRVLIDDLSIDQFADMYAQTIAYGLFAARCNHTGIGFTREQAGSELPKTNLFLRKLFNTIAGADLDERISWVVDDLAELLAKADTDAILEDFGKATRRTDPVVHFYETFLAAYDPRLRESRGVYYTPEPVVDYIVKSVDLVLKRSFGLKTGLADRSLVKRQVYAPGSAKKPKEFSTHRVQILDPACGTGTFLHAVVTQIRDALSNTKGMWPAYVAEHLLPRLYGFRAEAGIPSLRGGHRPISENTINVALRAIGFSADEMTAHGFRASASSLLNELAVHPDLIELQLAHAERNEVRAAYNRAKRIPERRKMMQEWADYLDGLRATANTPTNQTS